MVRPEVQEHELGIGSGALHAPFLGHEAQGLLLLREPLLVERVGLELRRARGMLLAQGMPFPARRREDPAQVRMALEADPEEVESLALVPVRGRVQIHDGGEHQVVLREGDLQAQLAHAGRIGIEEMVEDRERRRRLALPMPAQALVDRGHVEEQREARGALVAQAPEHLAQALARYPEGRDPVGGLLPQDVLAHARRDRSGEAGVCVGRGGAGHVHGAGLSDAVARREGPAHGADRRRRPAPRAWSRGAAPAPARPADSGAAPAARRRRRRSS